MKGEPTPNRVQSSVLELPRCEGGKYRKAGLKKKGERGWRDGTLSLFILLSIPQGLIFKNPFNKQKYKPTLPRR